MHRRPLTFSPLVLFLAGLGILFFAAASSDAGAEGGSPLPEPRGDGKVFSPGDPPPARSNGAAQPIVIDSDDRVRVSDTTEYPFSAVVWLELYDEFDEEIGNCTGTFIGPNAILTAGHCLYDPETGWIANIAVVPGKDEDYEPFGWEWAADYWVPDGWYDTGGDLFDWGIISMSNSDLGETVGWLYIAELTTETLLALDFEPAIVGYPGDAVPPGTMWYDWMPWFTDVDDFLLYHEIDTYPGMSGSAVFSSNFESDLLGAVVGIHVRGDSVNNINEAIRIDAYVIADLDQGCLEMDCTFEYYVEEGIPTATPTPTKTPTPTATPTKSPTPPLGQLGYKLRLPLIGRD